MSRPLLLCAALTLAAFPAAAETVLTINVPVDFHSLNEKAQAVRVGCRLTSKDPVTGIAQDGVGGAHSVDVKPDAAGNYTGTVAVTWDRNALSANDLTMIADPALTASCNFGLIIDGGNYVPNFKAYGAASVPTQVAAAPGTTFVGSTLAH